MIGNVSGGLAGGFLAMLINHIAMENVLKGNIGWLSVRQTARCYRYWNQACMIYAWQYLEKHRILFALAQLCFFVGTITFGLGILSGIPRFAAMIDAISLHIGILCAVACILGLYFIVISLVVNYGDTDEPEEEDPILTPIDSTAPIDGYTYCPPNRFILIANDESVPQPSRVAQLEEAHMRLRLWVTNLEKMVRKNQWTLSRSLDEEMDRTQDHLLQIEQRAFAIGAVESNLNCKELSYWVLTRFYEYHFRKNKNNLTEVSQRRKQSCLKQMQKIINEIGLKIIVACEKSKELQYTTAFQQENLEKAWRVFDAQVREMRQLSVFADCTSCEQWILQQDQRVKQCRKLLDDRKKYLEEQVKERQLYEQQRKSLEEQISQTQD